MYEPGVSRFQLCHSLRDKIEDKLKPFWEKKESSVLSLFLEKYKNFSASLWLSKNSILAFWVVYSVTHRFFVKGFKNKLKIEHKKVCPLEATIGQQSIMYKKREEGKKVQCFSS